MNHNVTLGIVAIVAAMTLTAVAFAIPQQALAYRHHNHNNHNNSIKVDQQINQQNSCTSPPPDMRTLLTVLQPSTVCENFGNNSADIHK
jgi:archaellin